MLKQRIFAFGLLLTLPLSLRAEYPEIQFTSSFRDPVFRQQQKETERWYYNRARSVPPPPLTIYSYQPREGDSLIQLAAVFNLTIDAIATLNNLENIHDFDTESPLLIPSNPGLFLHQDSRSSWNQALERELAGQESVELRLLFGDRKAGIRYFPGLYLPEQIRLRFVKQLFLPPLETMYVTSPFGYRHHPFTGQWELHVGTDYRAPVGTPVKSCADGTILSTGELEDYGKYIIINHRNGYSSMYGHLHTILVGRGQQVAEGETIATSGNSGLSTGPHLHFEIRKNGLPQNPENLLSKSGQ